MKAYGIIVAVVVTVCGVAAEQAQAGSRPTRNTCEIYHSSTNTDDLARKLPDALEKCGSNAWASIALGSLSAADVAGLMCRLDSQVVVDQGKLGCMIAVASANHQSIMVK